VVNVIVDVTGIQLIPGEQGRDCPGSGNDTALECCCDECDYLLCCMEEHDEAECLVCADIHCPRVRGWEQDDLGLE